MLDVLFIAASLIWVAEFIFFRSRAGSEGTERRSFPWIFLAVAAVVGISILSRESGMMLFPVPFLPWAGLILYIFGIFLRYWGIRELGSQFTRDVEYTGEDRLVSSGPFRRLRHPLYTGLLSIVAGFALFMSSAAGFLLTLVLFLPLLLNRIRSEEQLLIRSFGEEYRNWLKHRYRLIPFIY
ncbi:methyltransferase family protein [Alkalicoccus urumqiensis]|uniref:Isoprenylcysteine carboxylmethyltransferase family protein n=1 Tax=Alkalicoccus urumqiensis TaxID=1548213 RepID=A0A2P6MH28_ALKUR|nr:isoprenylcysteine carboxylmethyltransferase family protein [Alkalicoccus urumqiensis]PRO65588.1 isoprenylcysteine carboxylmethyltransferase family protein [Alkalicoccus urumqiensis]